LLRLGVVPIINENDTVVTDEIKFGDNDTLGALVANLIEADALIILTDQHGLYSPIRARTPAPADPARPRRRPGAGSDGRRRRFQPGARRHADENPGRQARRQVRRAYHHRLGRDSDVLARLAKGEAIGTSGGANGHLTARKQWMADHLHTAGAVVLDAGAVQKLPRKASRCCRSA
jgi:glutamate 5-kinase